MSVGHKKVLLGSLGPSGADPSDIAFDGNIANAFAHVEVALDDHFHNPDVEGARAFYAGLAAHDLGGQPVWAMVVAPPGCGKTELINPMLGLSNVHVIDSVTPNTFISGKAPEPNKPRGKEGLLERIGERGMILVPDFSTILAKSRQPRADIFAQLRCIYDGKLRREFGIDGLKSEWRGRITLGAAVTPVIDRHTAVFGSLGDRFLLIRWKRIGGVDAAMKAMNQDFAAKEIAMRSAVHTMFTLMESAPEPHLDTATTRTIAAIAEIVALGRPAIEREHNDELLYEPEAEGATRLSQQLCQLAKGSARLDGRDMVSDSDLKIVHRVAWDTLPPLRAKVLRALLRGEKVESTKLSPTTLWRITGDLQHVGLMTSDRKLAPEMCELFDLAGLVPVP